jgi:hypothetical protein
LVQKHLVAADKTCHAGMCKACFVVVQAQTDTRPSSEGVDLAFGTKRDDIATPPAEIVATHSGS